MRGRPPGRPLSDLELRHLRLLWSRRERAQTALRAYDAQLEDFVLELREEGSSVRGLAEALGVGSSTIQTWTNNARRRRRSGA